MIEEVSYTESYVQEIKAGMLKKYLDSTLDKKQSTKLKLIY